MAVSSDFFDLRNWKLTLPVDSKGGLGGTAVEVKNLIGYENSKYFYDSNGAMVFRASVDGATTSGSKYARTELREMNGTERAAWSLKEGGTLTATLDIDAVPKKADGTPGRIVIGQIHGEDEELVRLYYENGTVYFMNDQAGAKNSETQFLLKNAGGEQAKISLNETFSYKIEARGDTLKVEVHADGQVYSSTSKINSVWQSDSFYFKAGVYLGVNEDTGSGSGQATFHKLDFGHKPGSGLGGLNGSGAAPAPPPVADDDNSDDGSGGSGGGSGGGGSVPDVSDAAKVLFGGSGADRLQGGNGADTLGGRAGDDVLYGGGGNDQLIGSTGRDTAWGGAGNDLLKGEGDADLLYGEAGHDTLRGHQGNDRLYGGAGNDLLEGYQDHDTLWGDAGNDRLLGGDGNDTLIGGDGADTLTGGAGADLFTAGSDGVADLLADYSAGEKDRLQGGTTWKVSGGDTLVYDSAGKLLFRLEDYDAGSDGILFA